MYIEGRKQKKYSEKLYGEMCVYYLFIINEGTIPFYILENKLDVSERTLFRYVKDLTEKGFLPPMTKKIKKNEDSVYLYFAIKDDPSDSWINRDFEKFLKDYYLLHPISRDLSDRTVRSGIMLYENIDYGSSRMIPLDDCDEDDIAPGTEIITIDGEEYIFYNFNTCDENYTKTSLRTQQRDIRLVKDVFIDMYEP